MAERLPTYRQENPQLKVQNVSGDAGFDSYAQAFGQLATGAARLGESLEAQASQNALLSAQGDIEEAQKTAKLAMVQNPNNSTAANSYFDNRLNQIKENTSVNMGDRTKLDYLTKKVKTDFAYEVAKTEYDLLKETRKLDAGSYWSKNFPLYQAALGANDGGKLAGNIEKELTSFLKNQVSQGIFTGHEALLYLGQMQKTQGLYQNILDALGNPNTTANDVLQIPGIKQYADATGMPLPENHLMTKRAEIQTNDHSFQGLKGLIFAGGQATPSQLFSLGNQGIKLAHYQRGASRANLYAYGNNPYPAMINRYNELKETVGRSSEEEGELGRLKNIVNQVENHSYDWITNTSTGSQYERNYRMERAAIDRNKSITTTEKEIAKRKLTHDFHTKINSLYEAQKVPTEYRQFYNSQYIQDINNSLFVPGADKNAAIIVLAQTPKTQLPYLASSMPNPYKGMATYLIGKGAGVFDQNFISNLTDAVSDREEKLPEGITSKGERELISPATDKAIEKLLVTSGSTWGGYLSGKNKWQDLINYNSVFPRVQGLDQNDLLIQTGVRYIKERMRKSGDLTGSSMNEYIAEYASNVIRASNIERQGVTTLDLSVIPLESEYDHLTLNYELNRQVVDRLHDTGLSYARITQKLKDEGIKFYSTPTGHIIALNNANQRARYLKDGKDIDLFNEPYSDNLLASAHHHLAEFKKSATGRTLYDMLTGTFKDAPTSGIFGTALDQLFGAGKYLRRGEDEEAKIRAEKVAKIPVRRDR